MSSFESQLGEIAAKLNDLHPDESVPPVYVSEMLAVLMQMGGYIDELERAARRANYSRLF